MNNKPTIKYKKINTDLVQGRAKPYPVSRFFRASFTHKGVKNHALGPRSHTGSSRQLGDVVAQFHNFNSLFLVIKRLAV